jgi:hypothetical protein
MTQSSEATVRYATPRFIDLNDIRTQMTFVLHHQKNHNKRKTYKKTIQIMSLDNTYFFDDA